MPDCRLFGITSLLARHARPIATAFLDISASKGMAAKASTRAWSPPEGAAQLSGSQQPQSSLLLYNSLVDEKVPFVPADGLSSKQITWYTCGPTVYDIAHVGHARNYLTFDIIRRVLEDYFGYNCLFVMNVTDVDDKIILRARRNYLLSRYVADAKGADQVKAYALSALQDCHDRQSKKHASAVELSELAEKEENGAVEPTARRKRDELLNAVKNEAHKLLQASQALDAVKALQSTACDVAAVISAAGDYIAEALDREHGDGVTDASIYRAHAAKYEADFFQDMDALGCRKPDVLTRVSEYIPQIIEYVERILANGLAYESNGSVYFDTRNFRECGHTYGKLKPWAVGSALLACEGEANFETKEKRTATDFALWKASKPGEPFWESPWGNGRPGWHIECSAMASSILGAKMDIHSGGEDLRFPHHDNELAQAEAYYHHEGCHQWVNYFLHTGHLEVEGLKMSKSLKNFISIKDTLSTFTARQLRLMFALQPWGKSMMYGEAARAEMRARESQLKNFFQNIEVVTRGVQQTTTSARWTDDETDLCAKIKAVQRQVHERLCDNVDTAGAMDAISELIKQTNVYLQKKEAGGAAAAPAQPLLLRKASTFVTRILSAFGIIEPTIDRPGFGDVAQDSDGSAAAYLDTFASFRDEVRSLARAKADPKEILAACDRVRDSTLVELGVRLEDKPDGKAVWKLDDPAAMKAEQVERARQAAEMASKKLQTQLTLKLKDKEKFEKLLALPPVEQSLADKYSRFDAATGEPTHDKEGKELEGKAKEKGRKDLEKAKKVMEPLSKKLAEDPEFMSKLQSEIEDLTQQLAKLSAA